MPESVFHVRRARWPDDADSLRRIREQVFVLEQKVPLELEWDGRDDTAVHMIAEDRAGRPIGTARLLPDGQIGRMAVLPKWRRRGVGGTLLRELLDVAALEPGLHPFLNAQSSALGFYRTHGFLAQGDEFMEAGIAHQRMCLPDRS